jgi:transposase-like protein
MGTKDKERRAHPKEFKAEAVALAGKRQKPVRAVRGLTKTKSGP